MSSFQVRAISTSVFRANQDILDFVFRYVPQLKEGSVLAITSKIVSLSEGALVPKDSISKADLVRREADEFLGTLDYGTTLTLKAGLLVAASGIDESNSETGDYIVYPSDPYVSARALGEKLQAHYGIQNLGLILTDSHTQPLRRGVTGMGLAHWGFKATRDLIGHPDLFGRALKMTSVNVLDALAASAVFAMGEASESCPLAIIEGAQIEFQGGGDPTEIQIAPDEDLYRPLIRALIKG